LLAWYPETNYIFLYRFAAYNTKSYPITYSAK